MFAREGRAVGCVRRFWWVGEVRSNLGTPSHLAPGTPRNAFCSLVLVLPIVVFDARNDARGFVVVVGDGGSSGLIAVSHEKATQSWST